MKNTNLFALVSLVILLLVVSKNSQAQVAPQTKQTHPVMTQLNKADQEVIINQVIEIDEKTLTWINKASEDKSTDQKKKEVFDARFAALSKMDISEDRKSMLKLVLFYNVYGTEKQKTEK